MTSAIERAKIEIDKNDYVPEDLIEKVNVTKVKFEDSITIEKDDRYCPGCKRIIPDSERLESGGAPISGITFCCKICKTDSYDFEYINHRTMKYISEEKVLYEIMKQLDKSEYFECCQEVLHDLEKNLDLNKK